MGEALSNARQELTKANKIINCRLRPRKVHSQICVFPIFPTFCSELKGITKERPGHRLTRP
ncbi:MAG: hypothetical protein Ct9H90mP11_02270 [Acidimicrobiales bacterium]|nr:MAG: hypothetical protein Ct9H90mP11_02270 [Acidimicrobiales bacterium]